MIYKKELLRRIGYLEDEQRKLLTIVRTLEWDVKIDTPKKTIDLKDVVCAIIDHFKLDIIYKPAKTQIILEKKEG